MRGVRRWPQPRRVPWLSLAGCGGAAVLSLHRRPAGLLLELLLLG